MDAVPAAPLSAVQQALCDSLEVRAEQLIGPEPCVFQSIEPDAIASASIAQVHRAMMWRDGQTVEVAIKLQHPYVRRLITNSGLVQRKIDARCW